MARPRRNMGNHKWNYVFGAGLPGAPIRTCIYCACERRMVRAYHRYEFRALGSTEWTMARPPCSDELTPAESQALRAIGRKIEAYLLAQLEKR